MSYTPGGERNYLKNILPLKMPLMIQIFPIYACNFHCEFCIHGLKKSQHGFISEQIEMDMDLYKKVIFDLQKSGEKIKMLRFAAIGEPLLHPDIIEMIKIAQEAHIAESVDIVTNASLLTKDLSDGLIKAGLSRLRISIEGLNNQDYAKRCKANIDFDNMVNNIQYFYEHKTDTTVYIKIIDYMLKTKEEEKKFYQIFEPISDSIAIEHLTPTIDEIDYGIMSNGMKLDKGQNGDKLLEASVCPQPFYMLQVNPDGNVVPCCSMTYPQILGNIKSCSVQEVWEGKEYNNFRRKLLVSREAAGKVCKECSLYRYDLHKEDVIDEVAAELVKKYK